MQLNASFVTHGILDNTQEPLVTTFADDHSLSNELVTAKTAGWRHTSTSIAVRCVQGRVQPTEIGALCLSPATLGSHSDNIRTANDENALVFVLLAVSDKQGTSMDVDDLALATFTTILFNIIFVPDL